MTSYQYIQDLFAAILTHSKAIQGRFYIGNRYGLQDVNYDNLGQTLDKIQVAKKYPLVMMAPPTSTVKFTQRTDGWEEYRISMFFVKQSLVEDIIPATRTSAHTIVQDWHDMKRVAVNFFRVLNEVMRQEGGQKYRFIGDHNVHFSVVSNVGADRIAGVRADFDFQVFIGCEIEDYESIPVINVTDDSHPEHTL